MYVSCIRLQIKCLLQETNKQLIISILLVIATAIRNILRNYLKNIIIHLHSSLLLVHVHVSLSRLIL